MSGNEKTIVVLKRRQHSVDTNIDFLTSLKSTVLDCPSLPCLLRDSLVCL